MFISSFDNTALLTHLQVNHLYLRPRRALPLSALSFFNRVYLEQNDGRLFLSDFQGPHLWRDVRSAVQKILARLQPADLFPLVLLDLSHQKRL